MWISNKIKNSKNTFPVVESIQGASAVDGGFHIKSDGVQKRQQYMHIDTQYKYSHKVY